MADDFGEKTEAPSDKRLREAREKGNIPKSQDVNSIVSLIVAFFAIYLFGGSFFSYAKEFFVEIISLIHIPISDVDKSVVVYELFQRYVKIFISTTGPIILPIVIAGLVVNIAQVGINFLTQPLEPKLEKLNPLSGIKNLISLKSLVDMTKNILKLIAVTIVSYFCLKDEIYLLPKLVDYDILQIFLYICCYYF